MRSPFGRDRQEDRAARSIRPVRREVRERATGSDVGQAVGAGRHDPDAAAGVVGEEQGAVIGVRVAARSRQEGQAGDRRAAGPAAVAGRRPRLSGCRCSTASVTSLACRLLQIARPEALVRRRRTELPSQHGQPKLRGAASESASRSISSQVLKPTSPIQTSFVPGPDREPERVAQPVGDDPACVGVPSRPAALVGQPAPGVGIDPHDRRRRGRPDRRSVRDPGCAGRHPRPSGRQRRAAPPGGSPHGFTGVGVAGLVPPTGRSRTT